MTLLRALADMTRRSTLEDPELPITSTALAEWLGQGFSVDSGVTVTPVGSLAMAAVWRGVNLLSGVCAGLPLKGYRRSDDTRASLNAKILTDPHPEMTGFEFWRLTYAHRMLWGNFYGRKVKALTGQIGEILPLNPEAMRVHRFPDAVGKGNPTGKVFVYTDEQGTHSWTPSEVLHIPGFGYDGITGVSPIRMARQAIGLSLAAEKYGARLFGSGSLMSGVLQTEQRLDADQANLLKANWKSKMAGLDKSHEVAILDSGAKFQSLTMPNSDAQFLETRRFQAGEIERFLGIPPFLMMDTERSTSWGTGLEQQATGWVVFDLTPQWLKPTEARVTKELLLDTNSFAEYSVEGLLRGDSAARGMFYRIMREVGAFSANDIRRLENRPPIADGDQYLQPLNLAPLGTTPPAASNGPNPSS